METRYDLQPAADQLARLIQGVDEKDLGAPTPCAQWSVTELLEHILGLSAAFTAAAEKRVPSEQGEGLSPGWRVRAAGQLQELVAAWRADNAWTGETEAGGVRMPADQMGVVALDELVLHGWDLARATGQRFTVNERDALACHGFAAAMSEPGQEASRDGLYGPVFEVRSDAPILERLLGASGRDPQWEPPTSNVAATNTASQ
jgi:uncharacterized protein (TIGR03086 family)